MHKKRNSLKTICEGGIYKHPSYNENVTYLVNDSKTLLGSFLKRCNKSPKREFLGKIVENSKTEWYTYSTIQNMMKKLACYLFRMTEEGDLIGIYSINRLEWIIAEYASYELKCINCPLYSTYGPESIS
ncbi:Long-chain-fatty-acid--CoA ligase 5, partial [Astathelohania contejeani]